MAAAETLDPGVGKVVRRDALHIAFAGLRSPLRHCKWRPGSRKGLSLIRCSDVLIHPMHRPSLRMSTEGSDRYGNQTHKAERGTHKDIQCEEAKPRSANDFAAPRDRAGSKRRDTCDAVTNDKRVNIIGAFVGLDRFEIHHVAHYWVVVSDAIGSEDVAGHACAFERHPNIVFLCH